MAVDTQKEEKKYDEATQKLVDAANEARRVYDEADRDLRDVEREIKNLKETVEKDYGADSEFMPLQGQCFEYTDNEYTYKMCAFDYCSQRSKHGGSETRLGNWEDWRGPEGDRYSQVSHDTARKSLVC